ncbi:HupE/UreJ family protein [Microbacterium hominis]|uniref:HupE/UreJ family protein n=1 Tax=Microbacterium hominis TaxID=162426 RepID=UPI0019644DBB|nr:HupE/UreJ family protein [Microbacterium hominis]QRY41858.1 HupE/UreJ family protein [Microbacterium hominis]
MTVRRLPTALLVAFTAVLAVAPALVSASAALAHGFSSVVFADLSHDEDGRTVATLQLEYDLLVVSAADTQQDDDFFRAGTAAFDARDDAAMAAAVRDHRDTVSRYLDERFTVRTTGGDAGTCALGALDTVTMTVQEGVPYVVLPLAVDCPPGEAHVVRSTLFPDEEGYVTGTKTILTYDIDLHAGSAALDASTPEFSTAQSTWERFWEFFRLGAEHLLTGIDHILFLLALIAGSRKLREIVLAATVFTIAHSVTFILAATKVVSLPSIIIEPTIALSIAIVAAWYLFRLWREGEAATELTRDSGPLGLDRAGWLRLLVVFCFGLIHGLGFASALGIDEPWSWTLLWSLLVFNLGIEAVQIGLIALVFPVLVLLRRRTPRLAMWATGALAVAVTLAGLIWFVQRVFGWD